MENGAESASAMGAETTGPDTPDGESGTTKMGDEPRPDVQAVEAGVGRTVVEDRKPAAETEARGEYEESLLKEWVGLLVRAGFWALLIYLFIFQVSVVDGPSMLPTFQNGDRLVIDKLTYRFATIQRFDVIVFESIDREKLPRMSRDYIKRIIGLPGERVEVHGGYVWVRESAGGPLKKLTEPYDPTYADTLPGFSDGQGFEVPPGHYFVMGDNRGGSKDSRIKGLSHETLGFVSINQVKGVVRLRLWPWGRWTWFTRGQEQVTETSK